MKILLHLIFVMIMSGAYAQSNLPACQGPLPYHWTNCFGSVSQGLGEQYEGEWKDGKRHGKGTTIWSGGARYVGEFREGYPNGQGTYTHPDGKKYVGEGRMYRSQGLGTLYAANGLVINQGVWDDDKFVRSESIKQTTTPNAQASPTSAGIVDSDYCRQLLQTNLYSWTGECSIKTGTSPGNVAADGSGRNSPYTRNLVKARCPDGVASGLASTKWYLDGRLNQTSEGIYSNGSLNGSGVGQSVYEVISAYENVTGKPIPRYIEKKRLGDVEVSFANTHLSAQMMGWSPKQALSDMCRDSYKSCSS